MMAQLELRRLSISLTLSIGKITAPSSGQVMVLVHTDHRVVGGLGATGTPLLSSGDLTTVIASRRKGLSRLASKDHLIQRSLLLFRDALLTHARDILAGREDFGKMERTLTSVICVISSLDESMLADTLSVHLEIIKSLSFSMID